MPPASLPHVGMILAGVIVLAAWAVFPRPERPSHRVLDDLVLPAGVVLIVGGALHLIGAP